MRFSAVQGTLILALAFPASARAQIPAAEFAARRAALAAKLEDGVFVARGAEEPAQDYMSFFQSPGFLYLTGYREANAALVMSKRGAEVRWTLFVEKKVPAVEVWSGRRHGPALATEMTGLPARTNDEFQPALGAMLKEAKKAYVLADIVEGGDTLNNDDRFVEELRDQHPGLAIAAANPIVMQLRGTKSPAELELIRKAVAISMDAHREAMRATRPGMNEFEIQALVEYIFRRNGADRPAYASIVGSGPNSTTLHYNKNDRFMQAGDVIVMDVGAQYRGYAADITRSFPVSGTWTPEQRAVYQIVRDAQSAAERQARPGNQAKQMSDSALAVIQKGLAKLGLIESATATYECGSANAPQQCPQWSLFYMHGLGHGIGLEVHDPDQYYFTGVVNPGSAFTIEPGIYVRENLSDILPKSPRNTEVLEKIGGAIRKFANVGVRIEDNYIVTDEGLQWASCGLPREADEIEALMRGTYAGPERDVAKVEWYKGTDSAMSGGDAPKYELPKGCALKM